MQPPRLAVCLPLAAGLLAVFLPLLHAAEPAQGQSALEERVRILKDPSRLDQERVRARDGLLLFRSPGIRALIDLGKQDANDNVRMHVAIALSNVRKEDRADVVAALDMLSAWLDPLRPDAEPKATKEEPEEAKAEPKTPKETPEKGKAEPEARKGEPKAKGAEPAPKGAESGPKPAPKPVKPADTRADEALRYWAARAIVNLESVKALEILKQKVLTPDNDELLRSTVARGLAEWPVDLRRGRVVAVLLDLLKETEPPKKKEEAKEGAPAAAAEAPEEDEKDQKRIEMRIAVIDALRLTELNEELTVEPLLAVVKADPDEPTWRAAAVALRRLGGGSLLVPPGAPEDERQRLIKLWENWWRLQQKRAERAAKKEE